MRCLLLRAAGTLLRRRSLSGPLLLLGVAACLFYQSLTAARDHRNRLWSGPQQQQQKEVVLMETRELVCSLEDLQAQVRVSSQRLLPSRRRRRAVVLTGRRPVWDPEVQLYQRVLQQAGFQVQTTRFAETSRFLKPGDGGWSLLLCLGSSEQSCLRRISFSHLQHHQTVNLLPGLMEAFSDAGGGVCRFYSRFPPTGSNLPMRPHSCGSTNQKLHIPPDSDSPVEAPPPALVAMVNVYVLVTSVTPLTSFLHDISVVTTNQQPRGRPVKLSDFLLQQLGPTNSHQALGQVKQVISEVLQAATANETQRPISRCVLCFQLLTFSLLFSGSVSPVVVQVNSDWTFSSLSDETFEGQITKDLILEDVMNFLLPLRANLEDTHLKTDTHLEDTHLEDTHLSSSETREQLGSCRTTECLSEDQLLVLLQFQQQIKNPSSFQPISPGVSSSSSLGVSDLLTRIRSFYELQTNIGCRIDEAEEPTNQQPAQSSSQDEGSCVDPHLRQIYTDPALTLTPPFSPQVKEYRAEVTFDTVTIRIRPEPMNSACRVHLDEHRGPRMANFPVGLGNSRISILVTDGVDPEPIVMTIYTVHVFRESRPSLPMFGDHVTCSFLQDCGLQVQPGRFCGLQPHISSESPDQTCSSGDVPGRWVVPCLSCTDNRTCDWREVAWQPDGCYHPPVDRPLLQDCMTDRKVMFIGDSTNRGMMYFLMERLNSSLEDWGKAHDTQVYQNLNGGRSLISYSYYPQFWLEKKQRPTFRRALLQLLDRSRPLENSNRTVRVVGGVQWLNTDHLRTVKEVLDREYLGNILVVVKSLGMGFHLPVDGIRSLSLAEIQNLYRENSDIIATAKHHGYEVIDTFRITMGRYKEFLQGRCACHFHEVEKRSSTKPPSDTSSTTNKTRTAPGLSSQSGLSDMDQEAESKPPTYHVRGPVNQVYSEILLSRLCPKTRN